MVSLAAWVATAGGRRGRADQGVESALNRFVGAEDVVFSIRTATWLPCLLPSRFPIARFRDFNSGR